MTIDLSAEELERVILALKQFRDRRKADGRPTVEEDDLIARLEVAERDARRMPEPGGRT